MVLINQIMMKNCRLCHVKPGLHDFKNDKKLLKDIYECVKIKLNDKLMNSLPPSVCEECTKTVRNFSLFKQHIKKVDQCLRKILKNCDSKNSNAKLYKCEQCPAEFSCENIYNKHLKSHLSTELRNEDFKTQVTCPVCKESFECLEKYGCHDCCSDFREDAEDGDFLDLQNDKLDEESKEERVKHQFMCKWKNCNKTLSSAYSLKTHELKHEGKRSFLCVTCGKGFITKNSLTCHEKIHLDVKGYVCKLCNIGFSVRSNLRAHEKKHHEGVRFYCSQCTKAFASKCSLERHERIHTGIRDFKCQSCPSAFYTKKELLKHQRYHQGLRQHKCDECFKTFFERHHLIIHLRSHTGERPYVCKFPNCGKSFTESQKLKRHHNAKHT